MRQIKGTVKEILNDIPCKEGNAQFTTVTIKHLYALRVQRHVSVNLSKPACIQLQICVCAVLSFDRTQRTPLYAAEYKASRFR